MKNLKPFLTSHRKKVLDATIFKIEEVQVESQLSGKKIVYHLVDVNDWINVVALTPDHEIVLVKQYRLGADRLTIEIPGVPWIQEKMIR